MLDHRKLTGAGAPVVVLLLTLAGCASAPPPSEPTYTHAPAPRMVLDRLRVDPALEQRILAIDPERVSDADVREALAKVPAPRIVLLQGGIFPGALLQESFAEFLIRMGYPEEKIRDPATGSRSHSPYESSSRLAGMIAWYYEREGVRPLIVGHSQGGMQTVKVLYELAGAFDDALPVWNPLTESAEARTAIVDPLTGRAQPVVGLVLPFASAVGAGGSSMLLPNHWSMATRLYRIPDSVQDFTGYFIGVDLIALDFSGSSRELYRPLGTAAVRNVRLPADYSHLYVPNTAQLGADPGIRDWVNAWIPAYSTEGAPPVPPGDTSNIYWGADVWYSIKKAWVLEAQRLLRAKRVTTPG
jgi:hypothetical protein